MNNHNLVIYEFEKLYKILIEIKKDINLNFEFINNLTTEECLEQATKLSSKVIQQIGARL